MLAVAGAAENVEELVALAVVLGQRDTVVEDAIRALRTHPVREMNTEEPPSLVAGVSLIGFGVSSVLFKNTPVGSRLTVGLVILVSHIATIPQIVLIFSLSVILFRIYKVLLFACWPGEKLSIQIGVLLRGVGSRLATTEPA